MIVCAGSIAFDTTRTPFGTAERVLGGSASYFSLAASLFTQVSVVSAVGGDFPQSYWQRLEKRGIDLEGVQRIPGEKTFFFDSSFSHDLNARKVNKTETNCLGKISPKLPAGLQGKEKMLFLSPLEPALQAKIIESAGSTSLCAMDTITLFVENSAPKVRELIGKADGLFVNEDEARMLEGTASIVKAGFALLEQGPQFVVIKKGEHGAILFHEGRAYPFPAFPLEEVVDPTGAGDAFAGGVIGLLAKKGATRENITPKLLRRAVAYGIVTGSLAVEEFSTKKLEEIDFQDVEARFKQYCEMLKF